MVELMSSEERPTPIKSSLLILLRGLHRVSFLFLLLVKIREISRQTIKTPWSVSDGLQPTAQWLVTPWWSQTTEPRVGQWPGETKHTNLTHVSVTFSRFSSSDKIHLPVSVYMLPNYLCN